MKKEENTWGQFLKQLLYYHTVKVVQIRSWKLGLLYYFSLFVIIFYVGFYAIFWNKGYQGTGSLIGNTSVKVKGNAYLNNSGKIIIWDAQNVVYPPKEPDALFVTTNFLETNKQKRDKCTGNDESEKCKDNSCESLQSTENGITTGVCNQSAGYCELYAWCPLEEDIDPINILEGVKDFTVFVRVSIKFPKYNAFKDNANGTTTTMNYNLFTVGNMVERTGSKWETVKKLGAVIAVQINWDCDLDRSISKCQPDFSFTRIDNPEKDKLSKGYNFRYANYYYLQDTDNELIEHRDLHKLYGIRFIFLISGRAGKFDIIPLLLNIGSGLALLTIATIISDFITLFILPDRKFYNKVKYETISEKKEKNFEEEVEEEETLPTLTSAEDEESPLIRDSVQFQ